MSKNGKHPGGRPPKYRREYCQMMIDYFSAEPSFKYVKSEKIITKANGTTETFREYAYMPNKLPSFNNFADKLNVNTETLLEWSKITYPDDYPDEKLRGLLKYPEFSAAYKKAKELQEDFLVDNGLKGYYPPAAFIFVAKNITQLRDVKEFKGEMEVDHSTKGRPITGFNYLKPQVEDAQYDTDDKTDDQAGLSLPASTG